MSDASPSITPIPIARFTDIGQSRTDGRLAAINGRNGGSVPAAGSPAFDVVSGASNGDRAWLMGKHDPSSFRAAQVVPDGARSEEETAGDLGCVGPRGLADATYNWAVPIEPGTFHANYLATPKLPTGYLHWSSEDLRRRMGELREASLAADQDRSIPSPERGRRVAFAVRGTLMPCRPNS